MTPEKNGFGKVIHIQGVNHPDIGEGRYGASAILMDPVVTKVPFHFSLANSHLIEDQRARVRVQSLYQDYLISHENDGYVTVNIPDSSKERGRALNYLRFFLDSLSELEVLRKTDFRQEKSIEGFLSILAKSRKSSFSLGHYTDREGRMKIGAGEYFDDKNLYVVDLILSQKGDLKDSGLELLLTRLHENSIQMDSIIKEAIRGGIPLDETDMVKLAKERAILKTAYSGIKIGVFSSQDEDEFSIANAQTSSRV